MALTDIQRALLEAIDEPTLVDLLASLVNIPSPTGHEANVANYVAEHARQRGIHARVQPFAENRANVILSVAGRGRGPTLMLNGHLDTSYTGEEPELEGIGYKNEAQIIDGRWMYGNGVHNMKSAMASFIAVAAAIVDSGVTLEGDLVIAGVAGEIEKAPHGRFSGHDYEGFGTGTAYALAHGLIADMCILGEPTTNTIGLSNLGVNWLRIRTHGTMAHTQHASTAINAIDQMQKVYTKLQEWIPTYRSRTRYRGLSPAVDVTAIEGGWPYRLSRTAVACDLFLCVRTPPGLSNTAVLREIRAQMRELEASDPSVQTEIELYVSHAGSEISAAEPVVVSLKSAHEEVVGEPAQERPRGAYMDSTMLNAHGIPTVVYGPSGRVNQQGAADSGWSPGQGEHTYLPDLVAHARTVAAVVGDLCMRTVDELGLQTVDSYRPPG